MSALWSNFHMLLAVFLFSSKTVFPSSKVKTLFKFHPWLSSLLITVHTGPAPAILEWYGHCVRLSVKKVEVSGGMKNFEN